MPYKAILTLINIASCYWSLYKYATYFAKRHPKIVESEKAIEVVMRLEDEGPSLKAVPGGKGGSAGGGGRRMTVVAIDGAAVRRTTAASLATGPSESAAAAVVAGLASDGAAVDRAADGERAAAWRRAEEEKEKEQMQNDNDEVEREATLAGSDENEKEKHRDGDEDEYEVEQEILMPRIPPPAVARELRLSVAGELIVEERRGGNRVVD